MSCLSRNPSTGPAGPVTHVHVQPIQPMKPTQLLITCGALYLTGGPLRPAFLTVCVCALAMCHCHADPASLGSHHHTTRSTTAAAMWVHAVSTLRPQRNKPQYLIVANSLESGGLFGFTMAIVGWISPHGYICRAPLFPSTT